MLKLCQVDHFRVDLLNHEIANRMLPTAFVTPTVIARYVWVFDCGGT